VGALLHSEPKQSSMEWCHERSPPPKYSRQPSDSKIVANVFWDPEGTIHIDFLPDGVQLMHSITVTCFTMMWAKRFRIGHLVADVSRGPSLDSPPHYVNKL
jgi:hypothetical protein